MNGEGDLGRGSYGKVTAEGDPGRAAYGESLLKLVQGKQLM